ncbi:hypothetical protein RvY_17059 [Ramazzottius varieornatus]|uniref:SOCS box domain-containing protein n=1 Tax=Ramazzottius varieornatus TaxID=947166 RepID=A0A1D1W4U0_RAMVA|nr:hypothetical protein RvY_17059 [Ramazzottius varieornatus]
MSTSISSRNYHRLHKFIYRYSRLGRVDLIKARVAQQDLSPQEIHECVSMIPHGESCLVSAARQGHLDVVKYLVEEFGCLVEQRGTVQFEGDKVEGASALWSAAAAGFFEVVKYLVLDCSANVNGVTSTNSTPLRAACYDGRMQIVRFLVENGADLEIANRHGHTSLMIACYRGHIQIVKYLLERGASVNRKSIKGNTALHDCAESGHVDIMQLLIQHGAQMEKDAYGMTPLVSAAVVGHKNVVEYLVTRPVCSIEEHINALELLGATYIDRKHNLVEGLRLWERAMQERFPEDNALMDVSLPKVVRQSPVADMLRTKEFATLQELRIMADDPNEIRVQALLVRERILGASHPETSYLLRYRGAVFADQGDFRRCLQLWSYALEVQLRNLEPLNPMTVSSFVSFAELFSFKETQQSLHGVQNITWCDFKTVFDKIFAEILRGHRLLSSGQGSSASASTTRDLNSFDRILIVCLHLVSLFVRMRSTIEAADLVGDIQLKILQLIRLSPRGKNQRTLLHLACAKESTNLGPYRAFSFPCKETIQYLLQLSADPNAQDGDGSSVLCMITQQYPVSVDLVTLMMKHGGHIDIANKDRLSPVKFLKKTPMVSLLYTPQTFPRLRCLAAQAIRQNNIPFQLPSERLTNFISLH